MSWIGFDNGGYGRENFPMSGPAVEMRAKFYETFEDREKSQQDGLGRIASLLEEVIRRLERLEQKGEQK